MGNVKQIVQKRYQAEVLNRRQTDEMWELASSFVFGNCMPLQSLVYTFGASNINNKPLNNSNKNDAGAVYSKVIDHYVKLNLKYEIYEVRTHD